MKTTKFLAICAIALFCNLPLWAGTNFTNFCGGSLSSGDSKPTMTWETNHQGDVIITLKDGKGSTNTRFRANGMSDGLSAFYIVDNQKKQPTGGKVLFHL